MSEENAFRDDEDLDPAQDPEELEDRFGRVVVTVEGDEHIFTRLPADETVGPFEALRYDHKSGVLRFTPLVLEHRSMKPLFEKIAEIQVVMPGWDMSFHSSEHQRYSLLYARGLPKGFSTIYEFGIGIARDYRRFIYKIEELSACSTLRFVDTGDEGPDTTGKVFSVSLRRFAEYYAAVKRSKGRGQTAVARVIAADTHNALLDLFGQEQVAPKFARNAVIRRMTEEVETGHVIEPDERVQLADQMTAAAAKLGEEAPARLVRLRDDIELVSLDTLIEQFERDLNDPHLRDEEHWQRFFNNNRFALQLIFSAPIVVEREHAVVKAPDLDGRGSRITDFLCANTVTRTVIVVELKTPGSSLMASTPYRGKGTDAAVHAPHAELIGPVAQLQSQMSSVLQISSDRLPPGLDIDTWNEPRGAVITGRYSSLSAEQQESFLRYREGLARVVVLGYDEVLERLKTLRDALASPAPESGDVPDATIVA